MHRAMCILIIALALWLDPLWLPLVPVALMIPAFTASCTIFSDDFSTDRTGTDYTTVSGSWSVGSGVITCTSASAAIVSNTAVTAGLTKFRATVTCKPAATSDIGRFIFLYADSSNYWFAEIQPGASNGTLKLFQRSGGVNTQQGSTVTFTAFAAGDTATLEVCINSSRIAVMANETNRVAVSFDGSYAVAGTYCGIGTGSGTSSVVFDAFTIAKHYDDDSTCTACTYPPCGGGYTFPSTIYFSASYSSDTLGAVSTCASCLSVTDYALSEDSYATYSTGSFNGAAIFCLVNRIDVRCSAGTWQMQFWSTCGSFVNLGYLNLTLVSLNPLHLTGTVTYADGEAKFLCTSGCSGTGTATFSVDVHE